MNYSLESTPLQPETRSSIAEGYIWLDWFVTRLLEPILGNFRQCYAIFF